MNEIYDMIKQVFRRFEHQAQSSASITLLSVKYPSPTQEFYFDLYSKVWCTYRHSFPCLGIYTSDAGFGCMLRCGQMLLCNALLLLAEGRNWRISPTDSYFDTLNLFHVMHVLADRNRIHSHAHFLYIE